MGSGASAASADLVLLEAVGHDDAGRVVGHAQARERRLSVRDEDSVGEREARRRGVVGAAIGDGDVPTELLGDAHDGLRVVTGAERGSDSAGVRPARIRSRCGHRHVVVHPHRSRTQARSRGATDLALSERVADASRGTAVGPQREPISDAGVAPGPERASTVARTPLASASRQAASMAIERQGSCGRTRSRSSGRRPRSPCRRAASRRRCAC